MAKIIQLIAEEKAGNNEGLPTQLVIKMTVNPEKKAPGIPSVMIEIKGIRLDNSPISGTLVAQIPITIVPNNPACQRICEAR
jgi:hypothetical protein